MNLSTTNGGQRVLAGRKMHCSAGDTRMSPALKDAFVLLLVFAHHALDTGLGYLNKVFRKDKKIKRKMKDSQTVY